MISKWFFTLCILPAIGIGGGVLFWLLRPNRARVDRTLGIEAREIINNGLHNAFTDMIFWNGSYYLVYISSPSHFASKLSRLVILRSKDTQQWEEIAKLNYGNKDIRDPKLSVIQANLFLYVLLNDSFDPKPYRSLVAKTSDGITWTAFEEKITNGWLIGHPRSIDGKQWFVAAHWHEFDKVALFTSTDGENWEYYSMIVEKPGVDESAIEFLRDKSMVAVIRFEPGSGIFGSKNDSTMIITSSPPYREWSKVKVSSETRLDSPNLFWSGENLYAVGRYQPDVRGPFNYQGSAFSLKRTSLFHVSTEKLTHLSDLPSSGDTAYAGVVVNDEKILISYYSSSLKKDNPWLLGMLGPTGIYLASFNQGCLNELLEMKGVN